MLGNFACFRILTLTKNRQTTKMVCLFFVKVNILKQKCQTVWTLIRPDILSGQNCVQTVCKLYQPATKVISNGRGAKIGLLLLTLTCISSKNVRFWTNSSVVVGVNSSLNCASCSSAISLSTSFLASLGNKSLTA